MLRERDNYKCSKKQPLVCSEKLTTTSVVRGSQWFVMRR